MQPRLYEKWKIQKMQNAMKKKNRINYKKNLLIVTNNIASVIL